MFVHNIRLQYMVRVPKQIRAATSHDAQSLYIIAIGMLGATVMPLNLYLHSAIVPKPRSWSN